MPAVILLQENSADFGVAAKVVGMESGVIILETCVKEEGTLTGLSLRRVAFGTVLKVLKVCQDFTANLNP